jgi:hypothetical protein
MRRSAALSLVLGLGLLTAFTGCESLSSGDAETLDREAMLAEYGGFDTADELEAFGDSDLAASYAEEREFEDEMENHQEVRNAYRHGAEQYMLRLVWGDIQRPDTTDGAEEPDCPVTDWSGSLEISGGVATVKRLLRFEQPEDHIVRPRPGPRQVAWVSHTASHVDGILFKIIDTPDPQGREVSNNVIITTPFHTVEIPIADLADFREFIEIDECNSLSIVATEADHQGCPTGFLEGGWAAETDTSGRFRGAWISSHGGPAGYLRGRYEIRDGERVLYGKWITESGAFGGLIKGTWWPVEGDQGPDGFFEARWVDELFISRGVLKGHYHAGPEDGAGFFHGRWKMLCR